MFNNKACSGEPVSCHLRFYVVGDCIPFDDTKSRKVTGCKSNLINYTEYESRNCDSTLTNADKQKVSPFCENSIKNSFSPMKKSIAEANADRPLNPFESSCGP